MTTTMTTTVMGYPTMMPRTTTTMTTTTEEAAKFSGVLTVAAPGVTKLQIEAASANALAANFDVSANTITVTATESRRLKTTGRKLAGFWTVSYEFAVAASKVAVVEQKAADTADSTTAFNSFFATHLQAAGAKLTAGAVLSVLVPPCSIINRAQGARSTTPSTTIHGNRAIPPSLSINYHPWNDSDASTSSIKSAWSDSDASMSSNHEHILSTTTATTTSFRNESLWVTSGSLQHTPTVVVAVLFISTCMRWLDKIC